MGIRQRMYWLRQADAIRRQTIAGIAYGVGAGVSMVFSEQGSEVLDALELEQTKEESKRHKSAALWDMLKFIGGGKGV